jgi:phosphatidylserine/phosphatidylglycerophosphate/cardiolipin synthase-like enzyme
VGGASERAEPAAIISVYPNPVRDGDAGEYVVIRLPVPGNWTLSDGESTVSIRNRSGQVVVSTHPMVVRDRGANASLVAGAISLSNAGEALTLRRDGAPVDRVRYGDAPEGYRYSPDAGTWRVRGFSPREAVSTGPANATAFLFPDTATLPLESLESAEERLLLAGYTFSSERVTAALVAAAERGVRVRVLVEADPVSDIARRQARLLDRLVAAGVDVRVIGVGTERYAYHHPKYAVVDDRALVLTENWKPAGTGGHSSRGWGVRVANTRTASELAGVFDHDALGPDTQPWSAFRRGRTFEQIPPANGSYPSEHPPEQLRVRNVTVLTAPGNAESTLVGYIDDADDRVDVIQPTLGREGNVLVEATLRAARRGVEVRILLSGAWYVAEENAELVTWLEDWADRTDAPLSVKLAEPGGRYEKIHAKGVLVDDEIAVVGSLNWNRHSAQENREVALALHGPEPVTFYRRAFAADWSGSGGGRTWLFVAGAAAAVAVAGLVAGRTMSFTAVEQ